MQILRFSLPLRLVIHETLVLGNPHPRVQVRLVLLQMADMALLRRLFHCQHWLQQICGGEFDTITDVMSETELRDYAGHYKKLAGFDMEWLNQRPPLVGPGDRVASGHDGTADQ